MSLSLMSLAALAATEDAETATTAAHELPMPAYMYGVIALLAFALLLAVTWAFRGTAAKLGDGHHGGGEHGGHGGSHGGAGHH